MIDATISLGRPRALACLGRCRARTGRWRGRHGHGSFTPSGRPPMRCIVERPAGAPQSGQSTPRGERARGINHRIAGAGVAYLAALLAVDHFVSFREQLGLGALTIVAFLAVLPLFPAERRAQALGVVCFATIGEVIGSILWGVYRYRLHNLPLFVPPAPG